MRHVGIFSLIALLFFACTDDEEMVSIDVKDSTEYLVTVNINWNPTDFPTSYPSNAHFSRLIGWSHDANQSFFKTGTFASNGIKTMAETGGTSPLEAELKELIEEGKGNNYFVGSNLSSGTGEIVLKVEVTEQHSSITLATMIAPSPDWYIAVVDINLMENNSFVDQKTVEAHVYDAGTDSGTTYASANDVTNPQMPIALFVDAPVGNGVQLHASIATVRFTKM
ncbi:spondin domain-containing protein [Lutimonas sp.]|uniref:spondin domain-containing protein n=1 Tax=Lutimonas sp. TaxID=1872403 RepID=UPI003D9AD10F